MFDNNSEEFLHNGNTYLVIERSQVCSFVLENIVIYVSTACIRYIIFTMQTEKRYKILKKII